MQQAFGEEIVDVDPNVVVIKGQINRPLNGQVVELSVFPNTGCSLALAYFAVEEDRPALLEEGEESLSVRHQSLQRPFVELSVLPQEFDESFIERRRDSLAAIVAAEQYAQQVRRFFD